MIRLSGVLITFNEEARVGRCLDSLAAVCDELVVVDSGSTDRTRELCEARGARVVVRPFDGFTTQKNFALDQAVHDHVLSLDADERLSPELQASILAAKADWQADGYDFNRLNFYGDKPIRSCGWYPDAKIRLWDRRRGRWSGGLVHETVVLDAGARQAHLAGDLLHAGVSGGGAAGLEQPRVLVEGVVGVVDRDDEPLVAVEDATLENVAPQEGGQPLEKEPGRGDAPAGMPSRPERRVELHLGEKLPGLLVRGVEKVARKVRLASARVQDHRLVHQSTAPPAPAPVP